MLVQGSAAIHYTVVSEDCVQASDKLTSGHSVSPLLLSRRPSTLYCFRSALEPCHRSTNVLLATGRSATIAGVQLCTAMATRRLPLQAAVS